MINGKKILGVIPARYGSTRIRGKLLADICGRPLIYYTYEAVRKVSGLDMILVATDDRRIFDAVEAFGGEVVMTSEEHRSGTDRIAEVAETSDADVVVNIQGDELFIEGEMINEVVRLVAEDDTAEMGTLAFPIEEEEDYFNPNVVKVVVDKMGFALYFSRALIPHTKDGRPKDSFRYLRHVGIYSFRRDSLLQFAAMELSELEKVEELEQLRALEAGFKIKVAISDHMPLNVDTPEDLERAREIICRNISS